MQLSNIQSIEELLIRDGRLSVQSLENMGFRVTVWHKRYTVTRKDGKPVRKHKDDPDAVWEYHYRIGPEIVTRVRKVDRWTPAEIAEQDAKTLLSPKGGTTFVRLESLDTTGEYPKVVGRLTGQFHHVIGNGHTFSKKAGIHHAAVAAVYGYLMEEERKAQQTARDFETLLQNPESRECWKLLDTAKPAKVKELREYHVTEGESIAQVAHNVGLSEKNLRGINKLEPGAEVPPGTVLKYPLV